LAAYSGAYKPQNNPISENHTERKEMHAQDKPHREQTPFPLQGLWKKIEAAGMETDDLLLALVLFLMYRESGDKDLLILLGAMLLS